MKKLTFTMVILVAAISAFFWSRNGEIAAGQNLESSSMNTFRFPLLGRPFGIYGDDVSGFESFEEIYIAFRKGEDWTNAKPDSEGRILLEGDIRTKDGTAYPFDQASLTLEGTFFKNVKVVSRDVNGHYFEFDGFFYERPQFRQNVYVDLKGTLRLHQDGKLIANKTFEFYDLAEE